jgi:LacI family transcriptional regulator
MGKTTIRDIAKRAKVGVGTVSRVLNNDAHVSQETRTRVIEVMRELDYTPSAAAIRLARRAKNATMIGLLLPDISNHFFFEIFEVIYHELRTQGIDILIFNYEDHHVDVISKILDSAISLLLIFNFQLDAEEKELLYSRGVQYLYVDSPVVCDRCVFTDNEHGGVLAAQYLLSKGVKNPCYVADVQRSNSSQRRLQGFRSTLQRAGIDSVSVYESGLKEEAGYQIAQSILDDGSCDGIFCFCDEIAAGVVQAIRERGSDVHVIGFDGLQISRYLNFSTITQHPKQIGRIVSEIAQKMVAKEIGMEESIIHKITPELVIRL